jgi:hypothetical protein
MPTLPTRRRDLLLIGLALIGVTVYALTAQSMGGLGFPLDDSWIHQTYGRNLALTGQWAYVPGVPSAGSTSPFYTVLLAVGYALRVPFLLWTYGLGALALAGAGLIGARLAEQLFPAVRNVGLWTGLALVTAWHLLWAAASGMETMLFSTLTLLLIYLSWQGLPQLLTSPPAPLSAGREGEPAGEDSPLHSGGERPGVRQGEVKRGFLFGLVGAVLIATRPEGVLLVGLLGLLMLIDHLSRAFWLWCAGAFVGGAVGIAPYLLLNLTLNGTILPNTFSAKQAENAALLAQPFVVNLWAMLQPLTAGGQLLLFPGAILALSVLVRRIRQDRRAVLYLGPLLWAAALILLYTLRLPAYYQHGRYVIPALAPFISVGVGGTLLLASKRRTPFSRVLTRSLLIVALAVFAIFWVMGANIFGRDVQMIQSEMVAASRWLAEHVPPDQLLAVHDIGAVGYFAPRPMLDLAGLVSPEVIPIIRDADALMALMQARGVRYLMVLPSQLPTLPDDPRLCECFNANGPMGGMAIYQMAWDGHCS